MNVVKNDVALKKAQQTVQKLVGKRVALRVNKGRNKVENYVGVVSQAHPNVFVVDVENAVADVVSCTYVQMLCKEISLKQLPPSVR